MKKESMGIAFISNFMGSTPKWYKLFIISCLIANPLLFSVNPYVAGWALVVEFILILAFALVAYPLAAGGLLAIEAVAIGMTSADAVYVEVQSNLPVILLLMFMVAGIFFMKESLRFLFTRVLVAVKSKILLSLLFCFMAAVLSAFLDALTVVAVIITACYGFYSIYHRYVAHSGNLADDSGISGKELEELEGFRAFLRNILMHAAVGTALGGAMTLVGEPQNLLIGHLMGWNFMDFIHYCLPVSGPVFISGLLLCILLEITGLFGYGKPLPAGVRKILEEEVRTQSLSLSASAKARMIIQLITGILLISCLALHVAEVGIIGLMVIILLGAFNGVTEEHKYGEAFTEALPFTALLVVFFSIIAIIHEQHLFAPVVQYVFSIEGHNQLAAMFMANGVLSAVSDNVFVATIYITEVQKAFASGALGTGEEALELYNKLAVAVNTGTNIPSVATPNGQAAFLFLLTSALAPLIRLSYMQMLKYAFPYAVVLTGVGLWATICLL